MKNILVKEAIEILKQLNLPDGYEEIEKQIESLETGDEEKIKEVLRGYLDGFDRDLQGGWDYNGFEADHFYHTALEIIARLYLNELIVYEKR